MAGAKAPAIFINNSDNTIQLNQRLRNPIFQKQVLALHQA
jgi:hypothetical protein